MNEDFESSVSDYNVVLSKIINRADIFISRGSVLQKLGKFTEAISDFDNAISIDPKNTQAFMNRGFAKRELGDFDGACEDWKQSKKMGNSEAKIVLKNNQC